jgi:hypothetical protein
MEIGKIGKKNILLWVMLLAAHVALAQQELKMVETYPPQFSKGVDYVVDEPIGSPSLGFLKLTSEYNQTLSNFRTRSSWWGNYPIDFWLKVAPGAKGKIVVAVGENEINQRLLDVFIDGEIIVTDIDPYSTLNEKPSPKMILLDAEDKNKDGLLNIKVYFSKNSKTKLAAASAVWWFKNGTLTQGQANTLMFANNNLKPDIFAPAVSPLDAQLTVKNAAKKDSLLTAMKKQADVRIPEGLKTLTNYVNTENPKLNKLATDIYGNCIFGHLHDPVLPYLPNHWFNPALPWYLGQWVWDTQFVLSVYAATNNDKIISGVYDNCRHAIETNPLAPKGSYRYGMLPNSISPLGRPYNYSQQPNLAWGILTVYLQTNNKKLLEDNFSWLLDFYNWYSTERDIDNDGLIEYGAYNQNLKTARYESFDDEPVADELKLTKHPNRPESGYWYGNIESVLLTCFVIQSERAMIEIANELGKKDMAELFKKRVENRVEAMQQKMWDQDKKFFFNLYRDNDIKIPIRTIQGFLTLTAQVATPEQSKLLVTELQDTSRWWSKYPVPTVAMDEPTFESTGFWRGDMWPPVDYMVTQGLNLYGYTDVAKKLTYKIIDLCNNNPINESYDATTGKPLRLNYLGMSSAIWNMVVQSVYGIQNDYRTIVVPKNAKNLHLVQGKIEVSYPNNQCVELKSAFEREFKVLFPVAIDKKQIIITVDKKKLNPNEFKIMDNKVIFTAQASKKYVVQIN